MFVSKPDYTESFGFCDSLMMRNKPNKKLNPTQNIKQQRLTFDRNYIYLCKNHSINTLNLCLFNDSSTLSVNKITFSKSIFVYIFCKAH